MFFKDNLQIYLKIQHTNCADMVLDLSGCQHDSNSVASISASWGLHINADKCAIVHFDARSEWSHIVLLNSYSLNGECLYVVSSHRDLGVLVDSDLCFHGYIRSVVSKAAGLSMDLMRSTLCRDVDFMVPLFVSHIRPLLGFASSIQNTGFLGDLRLLESVQWRWTRNIAGLQELSYSERLRALTLYSI